MVMCCLISSSALLPFFLPSLPATEDYDKKWIETMGNMTSPPSGDVSAQALSVSGISSSCLFPSPLLLLYLSHLVLPFCIPSLLTYSLSLCPGPSLVTLFSFTQSVLSLSLILSSLSLLPPLILSSLSLLPFSHPILTLLTLSLSPYLHSFSLFSLSPLLFLSHPHAV